MFAAGPISILLLVISSNLQSCFVAQATNIACGSIATFAPTPLVVARSSLAISRINSQDTTVYRIHGNADDSCIDAYTVPLSGSSAAIDVDIELSYFKGSEVYKLCSSGHSTDCAVPRLIPFFNPRQGAAKDAILAFTPVAVWTGAAAVSSTFTLSITAGSTPFTTLVNQGYTFPLALTLTRMCTAPIIANFPWGPAIAVNATALTVNASGLAVGVYSICMSVRANGTLVSDYFPISGILGHSAHNLKVGVPHTDVKWQIIPLHLSRLSYATVMASDVRFIAEKAIIDDGWKYFGIDTSADICSPLLQSSFDFSQLQAYNSTHVFVDTTIPLPAGSPGGGQGVLCGALASTSSWTLLSTSPYWPWVYECPVGYGLTLSTGVSGCTTCAPSATNQCNGNGNCGTFENKTHLRSSITCICNPRWFSADTSCDRYDLDPPVLTPGNGTYKTKHLLVTMQKAPTSDYAQVTFPDNTQFQCDQASCTFTITETMTVTVQSLSANDSHTLNQPAYTFVIQHPTSTPSITLMTSTPTASITPSQSASQSQTPSGHSISESSAPTSTDEMSVSRSIALKPTTNFPQAPTTPRPATTGAPTPITTAPSGIAVEQQSSKPACTVTLRSESNFTGSFLNGSVVSRCRTAMCTAGINVLCDDLSVFATFISPSDHGCNLTFDAPNGTTTSTCEVLVEPAPLTIANLYYSVSPTLVTVLRYRAAPLPYDLSSQNIALRACDSDVWTNGTLQLRRGNRCISTQISVPGFVTYYGRVQLDAQQSQSAQSNLNVPPEADESTIAAVASQPANLTPGGVILGVTTAVMVSLLFLTQLAS